MKKIKLDKMFLVALIFAILSAVVIFCISYQEKMIDDACYAIRKSEQNRAKEKINKIWFIDGTGLQRETVLMAACESGNAEMISYVLTKGADPNKTLSGHLFPLELYCRYGYQAGLESLVQLLECGAIQSQYTNQPAIFHLSDRFQDMDEKGKAEATEMTIYLLQYGAPLQYGDTSLLHVAAQNNMSALFYTMVHTTQGLQLLTMQNGDGQTPWDVAIASGSTDVQLVIRNLEMEYQEEQLLEETERQEQENINQENETVEEGDPLLDDFRNDGVWDGKEETNDDRLDSSEQIEQDDSLSEEEQGEEEKRGYYQDIYGD